MPIFKEYMKRERILHDIQQAFRIHKIVALLGPRQCGKTTLAKAYISQSEKSFKLENYFDLEKNSDLARLEQPQLSLENLKNLVVIDEIQRKSELFPTLRVLVDEPTAHQYLILGSASRDLIKQSSESLAGRIRYLEITPFSYNETHELKKLFLRGGFPKAYLGENDEDSYIWRESYVQTFLEQDIPNLGFRIPAQQLRRFWMMLAHYHGNIFNASEIGKSLMLNHKTIRHYLDILVGTFMIRELPPWYENISKRQVKSSKIYFRDSGLLHYLMGIKNHHDLSMNPKLGSLWEGFALEQILRHLKVTDGEYYFWSTHAQAELDLLIIKNGKRIGFEFKYTDMPKTTRSMHISITDLKLDHLYVIYPDGVRFPLSDKITACGLETYLQDID